MRSILRRVKLNHRPVGLLIESKKHMENELYCFIAKGLVFIIMHKEKASKTFKSVNKKKNDEDIELKSVANK